MAAAATYVTMNGMIVYENRGGVERDYVPDTLGSTVALLDSSQTKTDTWRYWPYGEVAARTGTHVTPFTFVGVLGYFKDILGKLFYVRARHYLPEIGRWLTADPLWPAEVAFQYSGRPTSVVDPSGLQTVPFKLVPPVAQPCYECLQGIMDSITGAPPPHWGPSCWSSRRDNDMQHGVASCKASKLCGSECAELADLREVWQRVKCWCMTSPEREIGLADADRDNENNIIGRCLARCFPKRQCTTLCQEVFLLPSVRKKVLAICLNGGCPSWPLS